jgi:hypothetical protein
MDALKFNNTIDYMVVGGGGEIISHGQLHNASGYRMREQVLKALTQNYQVTVGTEFQVNRLYFRNDSLTTLGSFAQWCIEDSSTAYSTRYTTGSNVTSVNFTGTYTATANMTCRGIALVEKSYNASDDIGSFAKFYSTNLAVSVGNTSKIIINWTLSVA